MGNRIITISREFGSGGRTIGREAAKKLGIPCYDAELISKIAEESGLAKDYIKEKGEYSGFANPLANILFTDRTSRGFSMQDYIWNIQQRIIIDLAEQESCVMVGRCADYILKDRADCLTVFVHADPIKRAERVVKVYGENEESPEKRVKEKDKRRKTYYRYYTDREWGLAQNYDICLDSGRLGIEKCVDILCSLY